MAFDHAYHGRTNLTMALTAKNMPYKDKFGPFAGEIYRMPMAYPLRWPGGRGGVRGEALAMVKSLIHTQVGEDNVAAVIIEPIQGEGGFVVPPDGFLPGLAEFCREHGIVFIADEIQTGFCRTGDWFACEHEGVVPDLVTTAKGIAGGLPLAAVTGRADIMDSVHAGGLGGTYGGNPVACAAALGAIETMAAEDLAGRARRIGEIMLPRLHGLAEKYPVIADVRGRGAMLAIELTKPGTLDPDPATTAAVAKACHQAGLVTLTCGTFGNVIRFLPPLVIGEDLLDEGLSILEDAFAVGLTVATEDARREELTRLVMAAQPTPFWLDRRDAPSRARAAARRGVLRPGRGRRRVRRAVGRAAGQGGQPRPVRGAHRGQPDRLGGQRAQRRLLRRQPDPRRGQRPGAVPGRVRARCSASGRRTSTPSRPRPGATASTASSSGPGPSPWPPRITRSRSCGRLTLLTRVTGRSSWTRRRCGPR